MALIVIEGTWEEIERRKAELIGHQLRVTIKPEKAARTASPTKMPIRRQSALGKYPFIGGGYEAFAKEKQKEIDREDRDFG
jgi:hypothetical protein